MNLVDRYILRNIATPLILALAVAGMLLMIEHMLRLFDFVLAESGPIDVVWRMLANLVPHYLGLALPLGAFLGIMLAFRNLSLSSELDALSSSGASFGRLLRPVYMLILVLMVADFLLVSYVQPYARYKYRQITFDVTSGALGIKIPAGEFIPIADDVTIRLGEINPETRDATNIFIERKGNSGDKTIVTARRASISTTPEITRLLMKLEQGRQIIINAAGDRIQTLNFDSFDLEVDLPAIAVFRARGSDGREVTITEMLSYLRHEPRDTAPLYNDFRAGFHWRIIQPLSFLVMPILAIAVGMTGRRRASTLKPILGVAILIIYHEVLQEWAMPVAAAGKMSPYVSMWGVFAIFMFISIFMYTGAVDQARSAKVMSRRQEHPVRLTGADSVADAPTGGAS